MSSFFFGFRFSPLQRSFKPPPLKITAKRAVTFVKTHSTIIVAATSGIVVSIYSFTHLCRVRAEDVLWDHQRGLEHTRVSIKDNPHRRFHEICSISWLESIAGIATIISLMILFVSHLPLPTVYASYLGWSALVTLPTCFYYGSDALFSWIGDAVHRVERRRRTGKRPKRIILVRHGQSVANIDPEIYQSTPDNQVNLSEKGISQSLVAGKNLRKIIGKESVRFYVSPYARSKQTYEGIIEGGQWVDGYTMREEPRLREQDWGNYQDPAQMAKVDKERRQFGSFYYRMPNGESGADVWDRVTAVWDTLYREFADRTSQNYVLVTHGLTIRLFLMRYFQWNVEQFNELWNPRNCQFAVMELQTDGKYRLWKQEDWESVEKKYQEQVKNE